METDSKNVVEKINFLCVRYKQNWRSHSFDKATAAQARAITKQVCFFFLIYFADRASQCIYLLINQLDVLNFIISLFQASACFEHMCSKHIEAWNKLIIKFSASSWLINKQKKVCFVNS